MVDSVTGLRYAIFTDLYHATPTCSHSCLTTTIMYAPVLCFVLPLHEEVAIASTPASVGGAMCKRCSRPEGAMC